jgi:hypothetical protein
VNEPQRSHYDETPLAEPIPDDVLIVCHKVFGDDGRVGQELLYFTRATGLVDWGWTNEESSLSIRLDGGERVVQRFYPLTALHWVEYQQPSAEFEAACDRWSLSQFGVTYADYQQASHKAHVIEHEAMIKKQVIDNIRRQHPGMDIDPDDISFNMIDLTGEDE